MSHNPIPTKQTLEARLAQMSSERRALVERLLKQKSDPPLPVITKRRASSTAVCSFAQQRMWFLEQLAPGNPYYNETHTLRLRTMLHIPSLNSSIAEIVRRHEILRTAFKSVNGQPLQVIAPHLAVPLAVVDLRQLPEADREAEASRRVQHAAETPFDPSRLPLLCMTLLQLGDCDFVLVVMMHHIVCDGWSLSIFFRELLVLYEAFSKGQPSPLTDLRIQYADFAVWQREWLKGDVLEKQISYWRQQLRNLPTLELAGDRPRPPIPSYRGARKEFLVPASTVASLHRIAQRENITLFMVLLAAFQVQLARYTGQMEVVVGIPVANRRHADLEGLIGFFVNSLVIRTNFSGNPSFREACRRVGQVALEAYAHQDVPFEKLVEELQPERDTARHPLFQVIVQQYGSSSTEAAPERLNFNLATSKFDLRLDLCEVSAGLLALFEYNTDLFDPETIDRMVNHFLILLQGIVTNPEASIFELPILTEPERRQLLEDWNATTTDYERDASVKDLFELQVRHSPNAIAIVSGKTEWSYGELNRHANLLANRLIAKGVGPETVVGITAQRSLEAIVGILAIVKAGAAYVPLDPAWPIERLHFTAKDTGIALALSIGDELDALLLENISVLRLTLRDPIGGSDQNPRSRATADNLIYVMYTSGSTGSPKGVSITHRGVTRLVSNSNCLPLGPSETILQFAPLAFDAATFEIWGALLNGGRLVIFPQHVPSLEELGAAIEESGTTTLWLTASLFRQMVDEQLPRMRNVRRLVAGGDVLSAAHVRRSTTENPNCQIVNGYGPTENTTFTCVYEVLSFGGFGSRIPIGRPISNTRVYVLDGHGYPVPVGVAGELYIGGDGLARGYWNRSELTAERFLPSPFEPGGRLYRTGDIVRWRADGSLDFIGRIDNQVKIRGFRVEPGEIEAVMRQHSGVRDCVVITQEDISANKQLIAYVLADREGEAVDGGPSDSDELVPALRTYLRSKLPEYMIPSAFVVLDEFSLNANGKVDRNVLPAHEATRTALHERYIAPRNEREEMLAGLWRELLQVEKVSAEDNFFKLGGHSLLGTQLISRIRDAFQVELPLRHLFEAPTIADLAAVIEREKLRQHEAPVSIIRPRAPVNVEELSDEEVDAMLGEMLEGESL